MDKFPAYYQRVSPRAVPQNNVNSPAFGKNKSSGGHYTKAIKGTGSGIRKNNVVKIQVNQQQFHQHNQQNNRIAAKQDQAKNQEETVSLHQQTGQQNFIAPPGQSQQNQLQQLVIQKNQPSTALEGLKNDHRMLIQNSSNFKSRRFKKTGTNQQHVPGSATNTLNEDLVNLFPQNTSQTMSRHAVVIGNQGEESQLEQLNKEQTLLQPSDEAAQANDLSQDEINLLFHRQLIPAQKRTKKESTTNNYEMVNIDTTNLNICSLDEDRNTDEIGNPLIQPTDESHSVMVMQNNYNHTESSPKLGLVEDAAPATFSNLSLKQREHLLALKAQKTPTTVAQQKAKSLAKQPKNPAETQVNLMSKQQQRDSQVQENYNFAAESKQIHSQAYNQRRGSKDVQRSQTENNVTMPQKAINNKIATAPFQPPQFLQKKSKQPTITKIEYRPSKVSIIAPFSSSIVSSNKGELSSVGVKSTTNNIDINGGGSITPRSNTPSRQSTINNFNPVLTVNKRTELQKSKVIAKKTTQMTFETMKNHHGQQVEAASAGLIIQSNFDQRKRQQQQYQVPQQQNQYEQKSVIQTKQTTKKQKLHFQMLGVHDSLTLREKGGGEALRSIESVASQRTNSQEGGGVNVHLDQLLDNLEFRNKMVTVTANSSNQQQHRTLQVRNSSSLDNEVSTVQTLQRAVTPKQNQNGGCQVTINPGILMLNQPPQSTKSVSNTQLRLHYTSTPQKKQRKDMTIPNDTSAAQHHQSYLPIKSKDAVLLVQGQAQKQNTGSQTSTILGALSSCNDKDRHSSIASSQRKQNQKRISGSRFSKKRFQEAQSKVVQRQCASNSSREGSLEKSHQSSNPLAVRSLDQVLRGFQSGQASHKQQFMLANSTKQTKDDRMNPTRNRNLQHQLTAGPTININKSSQLSILLSAAEMNAPKGQQSGNNNNYFEQDRHTLHRISQLSESFKEQSPENLQYPKSRTVLHTRAGSLSDLDQIQLLADKDGITTQRATPKSSFSNRSIVYSKNQQPTQLPSKQSSQHCNTKKPITEKLAQITMNRKSKDNYDPKQASELAAKFKKHLMLRHSNKVPMTSRTDKSNSQAAILVQHNQAAHAASNLRSAAAAAGQSIAIVEGDQQVNINIVHHNQLNDQPEDDSQFMGINGADINVSPENTNAMRLHSRFPTLTPTQLVQMNRGTYADSRTTIQQQKDSSIQWDNLQAPVNHNALVEVQETSKVEEFQSPQKPFTVQKINKGITITKPVTLGKKMMYCGGDGKSSSVVQLKRFSNEMDQEVEQQQLRQKLKDEQISHPDFQQLQSKSYTIIDNIQEKQSTSAVDNTKTHKKKKTIGRKKLHQSPLKGGSITARPSTQLQQSKKSSVTVSASLKNLKPNESSTRPNGPLKPTNFLLAYQKLVKQAGGSKPIKCSKSFRLSRNTLDNINQSQQQQQQQQDSAKVFSKISLLKQQSSLGVVGSTVTAKDQVFPQIYVTDYVRKVQEERSEKQAEENTKRETIREKQANKQFMELKQRLIDIPSKREKESQRIRERLKAINSQKQLQSINKDIPSGQWWNQKKQNASYSKMITASGDEPTNSNIQQIPGKNAQDDNHLSRDLVDAITGETAKNRIKNIINRSRAEADVAEQKEDNLLPITRQQQQQQQQISNNDIENGLSNTTTLKDFLNLAIGSAHHNRNCSLPPPPHYRSSSLLQSPKASVFKNSNSRYMKKTSYSRAADMEIVVPMPQETRKFINTSTFQAHQQQAFQRNQVTVDPQYATNTFQTLSIVTNSKECTPQLSIAPNSIKNNHLDQKPVPELPIIESLSPQNNSSEAASPQFKQTAIFVGPIAQYQRKSVFSSLNYQLAAEKQHVFKKRKSLISIQSPTNSTPTTTKNNQV